MRFRNGGKRVDYNVLQAIARWCVTAEYTRLAGRILCARMSLSTRRKVASSNEILAALGDKTLTTDRVTSVIDSTLQAINYHTPTDGKSWRVVPRLVLEQLSHKLSRYELLVFCVASLQQTTDGTFRLNQYRLANAYNVKQPRLSQAVQRLLARNILIKVYCTRDSIEQHGALYAFSDAINSDSFVQYDKTKVYHPLK